MPAILKVKLGRPLQMPQKRLFTLLTQGRQYCCQARNAAMMHWYRFRKDNPDWEPGAEYDAPEPKIKRKAKEDAKAPKDSPIGPRLFLSRELYAAGSSAAPNLAGVVLSSCCQDVIKRLKANTPYNHPGKARKVWRAILDNEVCIPTWREGCIPVPRNASAFGYEGHATRVLKDLSRAAESGCALQFPLLSRMSGYKTITPVVRLEVGDMSRGHRQLLRRLADGRLRLADSQLTEKDDKWFALLCYEIPEIESALPVDRVMTLEPCVPGSKWPFRLMWTDDDGQAETWGIGMARPLVGDYRRVETRRRAIRYRYRDGCGSGHGKQRWYKTIRPMSRAVVDMQSRFEKQTVADVMKTMLRAGCGKLQYREPSMPVRERSWFAGVDVPFGWATFEARLKFKVESAGLAYDSRPRLLMAQWKELREAAK